jgi:hypothetical protein
MNKSFCARMASVRAAELTAANAEAFVRIRASGEWFSGKVRVELARAAWEAFNGSCARCVECASLAARRQPLKTSEAFLGHFSFLERLAHVAAYLQHRLTQEWHDAMVQDMAVSLKLDGLSRDELFACFAELVIVASWSCGLRAFFDSSGVVPPKDLFGEGSAAAPLRRGVGFVRRLESNRAVGYSPYIVELAEPCDVPEKLRHAVSGGPEAPFVHVLLAHETWRHWCDWWSVMYIPGDDVIQALTKPAPPSRKLSRAQMEVVVSLTLICFLFVTLRPGGQLDGSPRVRVLTRQPHAVPQHGQPLRSRAPRRDACRIRCRGVRMAFRTDGGGARGGGSCAGDTRRAGRCGSGGHVCLNQPLGRSHRFVVFKTCSFENDRISARTQELQGDGGSARVAGSHGAAAQRSADWSGGRTRCRLLAVDPLISFSFSACAVLQLCMKPRGQIRCVYRTSRVAEKNGATHACSEENEQIFFFVLLPQLGLFLERVAGQLALLLLGLELGLLLLL